MQFSPLSFLKRASCTVFRVVHHIIVFAIALSVAFSVMYPQLFLTCSLNDLNITNCVYQLQKQEAYGAFIVESKKKRTEEVNGEAASSTYLKPTAYSNYP